MGFVDDFIVIDVKLHFKLQLELGAVLANLSEHHLRKS